MMSRVLNNSFAAVGVLEMHSAKKMNRSVLFPSTRRALPVLVSWTPFLFHGTFEVVVYVSVPDNIKMFRCLENTNLVFGNDIRNGGNALEKSLGDKFLVLRLANSSYCLERCDRRFTHHLFVSMVTMVYMSVLAFENGLPNSWNTSNIALIFAENFAWTDGLGFDHDVLYLSLKECPRILQWVQLFRVQLLFISATRGDRLWCQSHLHPLGWCHSFVHWPGPLPWSRKRDQTSEQRSDLYGILRIWRELVVAVEPCPWYEWAATWKKLYDSERTSMVRADQDSVHIASRNERRNCNASSSHSRTISQYLNCGTLLAVLSHQVSKSDAASFGESDSGKQRPAKHVGLLLWLDACIVIRICPVRVDHRLTSCGRGVYDKVKKSCWFIGC